jgi:hypothetical protein
MGHLKILINKCCQKVPMLSLFHGFDVFLHSGKGIFFFLVNDFCLTYLCLWFLAFGPISHALSAIPFDVSRFSTVEACLLLFSLIRCFSDINIHTIFRTDVVALLLIEQLQAVGFLFARVLAVPLS